MTITIVNHNIFNAPKNQIICHQVNCQGKMGRGIALTMKQKFPEMYDFYVALCEGVDMLGKIYMYKDEEKDQYIANLFGQNRYGRDRRYTDYNAVANCLEKISDFATHKGLDIAIPYKMGCSNAGGNWNIIYTMIDEICSNNNVFIYQLK